MAEVWYSSLRVVHDNLAFRYKLIEICRENEVAMAGIFGSMARGEATNQSDVDLVVRFSKRKGLLDLVRLEREISVAPGREVDLLTEAAITR